MLHVWNNHTFTTNISIIIMNIHVFNILNSTSTVMYFIALIKNFQIIADYPLYRFVKHNLFFCNFIIYVYIIKWHSICYSNIGRKDLIAICEGSLKWWPSLQLTRTPQGWRNIHAPYTGLGRSRSKVNNANHHTIWVAHNIYKYVQFWFLIRFSYPSLKCNSKILWVFSVFIMSLQIIWK